MTATWQHWLFPLDHLCKFGARKLSVNWRGLEHQWDWRLQSCKIESVHLRQSSGKGFVHYPSSLQNNLSPEAPFETNSQQPLDLHIGCQGCWLCNPTGQLHHHHLEILGVPHASPDCRCFFDGAGVLPLGLLGGQILGVPAMAQQIWGRFWTHGSLLYLRHGPATSSGSWKKHDGFLFENILSECR